MSQPLHYEQLNRTQHLVQRVAASRPGAWLFGRVLWRLDPPIHRLTRGRHTLGNLLSGLPVVMLTTTGAKSGLPRSAPVAGLPMPTGIAVIASSFGRAKHPGWYFNLRAHPDAVLSVNGISYPVRAEQVTDDAKVAQIWRQAVAIYPGWANYQKRVKGRSIGVFLLVPRGEGSGEQTANQDSAAP